MLNYQLIKNSKLNSSPMKKFYTLFFVTLFSFGTLFSQTPLSTAVDFTVTDIYGTQYNLFTLLNSNKYVCLDFFYIACPACAATAPYYQSTYSNFGCNTGNVIFIAFSSADNQAALVSYSQTHSYSYPMVDAAQGAAIHTTYGIPATPTYILIAPNKTIVEKDMWPVSSAQDLITPITNRGGIAHSCAAGIEINNNYHEFLVYPNPANKFINIDYVSGKSSTYYKIEIFDILGDIVNSIVIK